MSSDFVRKVKAYLDDDTKLGDAYVVIGVFVFLIGFAIYRYIVK